MNHLTIGIHINNIQDYGTHSVIEGIHGDIHFEVKTPQKLREGTRDVIITGKVVGVENSCISLLAERMAITGYDIGCSRCNEYLDEYENEVGDSIL